MKMLAVTMLMLLSNLCSWAQHKPTTIDSVKANLIFCANKSDYNLEDFASFFRFTYGVESLFRDRAQLEIYLQPLKNDNAYKTNIKLLVNSDNKYKRTMAYRIIGMANDQSYKDTLIRRILLEDSLPGLWVGNALTQIDPTATSIIMEWMLKRTEGDPHLFPSYLEMDKKSLKKTAYSYLKDKRPEASLLAGETLTFLEKPVKPQAERKY